MTQEELEKELDRLRGDGFERTVIEAYKRALIGRTFQFGDTDKLWWFVPRQNCEIHIRKRGESIGIVDHYSFYTDNNIIYLQTMSKTYEFETYSRDDNDMITATIRLDGDTILLRQTKE